MYKNMKIAKKLMIPFIIVALISNIAGFVGLIMLKTQDTKYSSALITSASVQDTIYDYSIYLNQGGTLVRDIILLTDASDIKEVQTELAEIDKLTAQSLEELKRTCQRSEEMVFIKKIDEVTSKYNEARSRAVELGLRNKSEEALNILRSEANPYLNECMHDRRTGIKGSSCSRGKYHIIQAYI